jgi:ABC-2 type transport system permease protein
MDYIKLGRTGLDVSRICLGCMSYGEPNMGNHAWSMGEEESRPFIKQALNAGINFFDTANVYSLGSSEEIVGRALKDFAKRDEIVLATKVHGTMRKGPNGGGLSRKAIMSEIDASLKRLGTDYVDLYQIHRWDHKTPIEETLEALHDVVKAGKARYIGASSMFAWQFSKALYTQPASLAWFARHEIRLAWRETIAMMTGGRRVRTIGLVISLLLFAAAMHWFAAVLIAPWVTAGIIADKPTLVLVTGGGLLFWTVMLSQAMESVTRAYYTRSDLDLILSSPASARKLFAVRTGAVALTTIALTSLLASPAIDMLAWLMGAQWLAAYLVIASLGAIAATLALLITVGLFRLFGAKRTRLISQIIAGIIGAGFIIGIQAAAILSYGSLSRFSFLQSDDVIQAAPDLSNWLWIPARAAMGDISALLVLMVIGFGSLTLAIFMASSSFGRHAIAATSIGQGHVRHRKAHGAFRPVSQKQSLRRKEWKLLARDPWLLSQTLMQLLYLLPPALLLWVNFGKSAGAFVVVVPVLVMASGQLAGGLAWLAISGEDAYDLVATAPVKPGTVLFAKVEAVTAVVAVIMAPLMLLIAIASPAMALVAACFVILSAGSATVIQLWFRVKARRAMFRRRQVASRIATLAEAFSSIMWAGTGARAATGSWLAIGPGVIALGILGIAKLLSPRRRD